MSHTDDLVQEIVDLKEALKKIIVNEKRINIHMAALYDDEDLKNKWLTNISMSQKIAEQALKGKPQNGL